MAPRSRRDLKREAILAVAKEMFFAQGYSGVSMDDIVARVSGSKATLYSHFPSKDQLLLALVREATVGAIAEAVDFDPGQDFSVFLRKYGRIGMRWRTSNDVVGLERLAASEALRFPEFGRTCYEQGVLPNRRLAANRFEKAMDKGLLRRTDPLLATDQFMGMCAGWLWRRQIWGVIDASSPAQINANVDAAVETFLHGHAKARAREKKKARKQDPVRANAPAALPVQPPVRSRRDLKRHAIIAAAKQLFFAEGYANVSMNRVVERVGGSKATLYSHFPSKQALLLAVVQDVEAGQHLHNLPGAREAPEDFRAWLGGFGRVAASRLMSEEFISLQRLAAGEAVQLPEVGQAFYEASIVPAFAQFAGYFSDAMDRGELRRAPAELAAEQFVEMCTGGRMRQLIWGICAPPSASEIAEQVDAAVATFMDGNAKS
jgi:TetR/AcrR family transcriptional regulator, mexJK operon transcriptional repressor